MAVNNIGYQDRVVLFLDILGFKKHVSQTVSKEGEDIVKQIERINNTLLKMGDVASKFGDKVDKRMVTQFSDSIVISFDCSATAMLNDTLEIIMRIWVTLVTERLVCRGALSRGKLIHTNQIVFGPAMIDAYETESKAAMYPRIIMDHNLYNLARMYTDNGTVVIPPNVSDFLKMDIDGKYYLDYFNAARHVLEEDELLAYFKIFREIIIDGSRSTQPDLKVKYGYLKYKYNNFLHQFREGGQQAVSKGYGRAVHNYLGKLKPLKAY